MKGFDTKALILMPNYESFDARPSVYKSQLRTSLSNLISYFHSKGIKCYGIYTDDVMRALSPDGLTYINILSKPDSFWAKNHCEDMPDIMTVDQWNDEENLKKINKDSKDVSSLSEEQRFQLLLKHERKASQVLINSFKIVAVFNFESNKNYKVTSKSEDGKIRLYIDAKTMTMQSVISGASVNPCDLLQETYASRALYNWEVKESVQAESIHSDEEFL